MQWDQYPVLHRWQLLGTCDIYNETFKSPESFAHDYIQHSKEKQKHIPASVNCYEREGEVVQLPQPNTHLLNNKNFFEVFTARKTSRVFNQSQISLDVICTLLKFVFGEVTRRDSAVYRKYNLKQIGKRKYSPSGGALHPSEAYLLPFRVKGLSRGVYHYRSHSHELSRLSSENCLKKLDEILCGQYYAKDLSAGIFITSLFDNIWGKYPHSRAYRVALLDVGHVSQSLLLCATAMGLSTWLTAAFQDSTVVNTLKLHSISEQPILFVGIGKGAFNPVDRATQTFVSSDNRCDKNE